MPPHSAAPQRPSIGTWSGSTATACSCWPATPGTPRRGPEAFEAAARRLPRSWGVDPLPQTLDLHTAILRHEDPARLIHSAADRSSPAVRSLLSRDGPAVARTARRSCGRWSEGLGRRSPVRRASCWWRARPASEEPTARRARRSSHRLPDRTSQVLRARPRSAVRAATPPCGCGGEPVAAANPASVSALGEILPELGSSGLPAEAARARALESLAALVGQLEPLAFVIDDLQWVELSTIGALADLCRRRAAMPLVVVGAWPRRCRPITRSGRWMPPSTLMWSRSPRTTSPRDHRAARADRRQPVVRGRAPGGSRHRGRRGPDSPHPARSHRRQMPESRRRRAPAAGGRLGGGAPVHARPAHGDDRQPPGRADPAAGGRERRLLQLRAAGGFDFRHDLIRQALYQSLSAESRIALHGWPCARWRRPTSTQDGWSIMPPGGRLGLAVRYMTDAGDAARAQGQHRGGSPNTSGPEQPPMATQGSWRHPRWRRCCCGWAACSRHHWAYPRRREIHPPGPHVSRAPR